MTSLSVQNFISKLENDPAFRASTGITSSDISLEEFQAWAASAGFSFTPEEIVSAASTQKADTLTEEDLEQVTGGTKSSGKAQPEGHVNLVFKFKLVAVK